MLLKRFTVAAWVVATLVPATSFANGQGCVRTGLTDDARPGWTISGAWSPDGQRLVLVDALNNRLLTYEGPNARSLGPVPIRDEDLGSPFLPSVLAPTPSGFLLEMANARFVPLNSDIHPTASAAEAVTRLTGVKRGDLSAEYFFTWTLAHDEVLAFADFEISGEWSSGFVRIPLSDAAGFKVLTRGGVQEPNRLFYRLGHQLLTADDTAAYAVVMGERPAVFKSSQGNDRMIRVAELPAPWNQRPRLPSFKTAEDFQEVMQVVERSTLPSGLFAWEGSLYLVGRTASRTAPQWSLTRIDPASGRVTGTAALSTTANHLTVVPGAQYWAFVEKGPVEGFGLQRVRSILMVPAEDVKSLGSTGLLCERAGAGG